MFLLGILWTGLTENAAFTGLLVGFAMGLIKFIVENVYAPPDCGEEDTRPQFAKLHFMYYCKYFMFVACEQQTHFRSSLLSLRKIGREATTGNASAVRRLYVCSQMIKIGRALYHSYTAGMCKK